MRLPARIALRQEALLARWFNREHIAALVLNASGRLTVERLDGVPVEAVLSPESVVYSWLVILRIKLNDQVRSLLLHPGMTGKEGHRRLRVWLRMRALAGK